MAFKSIIVIDIGMRIIENQPKYGMILAHSKTAYHSVLCRFLHTKNLLLSQNKYNRDETKIVKSDGTVVRKKTERIPKILLFDGSKEKLLTISQADAIARHKRQELVKVSDATSKLQYPTFKLVTGYGHLNGAKGEKKKDKQKEITISTTIADHDFRIKLNNIVRMLKKVNTIQCTIKNKGEFTVNDIYIKLKKELVNLKSDIEFKIINTRGGSMVCSISNMTASSEGSTESETTV